MNRTMVSGGYKPAGNGLRERQADPKWSAPRISAADVPKYVGRDVTLVGETKDLDMAAGFAAFQCIVSQVGFKVHSTPNGDFSKINEITVFVEHPDHLVYSSHGMLNDDFHAPNYAALLKLINTYHQDIFGA